MKKSNSNTRHHNNHQNTNTGNGDSRYKIMSKNKTISTIVHTQHEQQQQTTKKTNFNKVSSCVKIAHSSSKSSKTNLKIQQKNNRQSCNIKNTASASAQENILKHNQQLLSENKILRDQYCKLQQSHLKDKAKIQLLIGRMSQIKSQQKNQKISKQKEKSVEESECKNKECLQKRKTLELQLHKERIKVFELENDKKKWDKSRQQLKIQYSELLGQINQLKERA